MEMKTYDYSKLFRAIDNAEAEEQKTKNAIEYKNKNELADLENKLLQSGYLEDWDQLVQAMKKLGIRGFPYPGIDGVAGANDFTDSYSFIAPWRIGINHKCKEKIVYGYYNDFDICEYTITNTDETYPKKKLIEDFMTGYPAYREFKLREIYQKLNKKLKDIDILKSKLK